MIIACVYGTKIAIKYVDYIEIFSEVSIILLGFQSMMEVIKDKSFP